MLTVESRLIEEHKTQLTKRNSEGELLWKKTINGTYRFKFGEATSDKDGNYFLTGSSEVNLEGEINKNHGDFDGYVMKLAPMEI